MLWLQTIEILEFTGIPVLYYIQTGDPPEPCKLHRLRQPIPRATSPLAIAVGC